ncbi:acetyl esterase/lipase [Kineococcus xinjiangensis]|uniref:Acetyl esterase/lipase n=1 Tax=Kineococcus xinjiangensis TaxID=512762 RepID=A0A2S6IHU4_9ACTN|nr:alpha/beta hydrolase [Kineococcus xinjiangensis]PPK93789.1 acetyl esterase/lipase [Kineococcus xinjiangensis]
MTTSATGPATAQRIPYGPHPDQWGELHLPGAPGPAPLAAVVVVHGGYWRDRYTAELGTPVAEDLARHGLAAWNLEYRRAGSGGAPGAGGWPATFADVAAGIDHLAELAAAHSLDLSRVALLGHSAGGHLAVWAAGRHRLPPGAPGAAPRVRPVGVVSQAGVLDLAAAHRLALSDRAVENLLGGAPGELPGPYALADPMRALPISTPVHAVHSRSDGAVPFALSADYVEAARRAGDPAELHETGGDHFAVITPGAQAHGLCRDLLLRLLR